MARPHDLRYDSRPCPKGPVHRFAPREGLGGGAANTALSSAPLRAKVGAVPIFGMDEPGGVLQRFVESADIRHDAMTDERCRSTILSIGPVVNGDAVRCAKRPNGR